MCACRPLYLSGQHSCLWIAPWGCPRPREPMPFPHTHCLLSQPEPFGLSDLEERQVLGKGSWPTLLLLQMPWLSFAGGGPSDFPPSIPVLKLPTTMTLKRVLGGLSLATCSFLHTCSYFVANSPPPAANTQGTG